MGRWPKVELSESGMREGMQIESKDISVEDKIRLLNALSETGLPRITVGSFVSPRYTPQMERIDEIVQGFTPKPGVIYNAVALNDRGVQRAREYSPPLTVGGGIPGLNVHLCDIFIRRNTNRSQADEMARWPGIVAAAKERGVTEAGIGIGAAWGSNFQGDFSQDLRMEFLRKEHDLWDEAGINVTRVSFLDPMSWCRPWVVEDQIVEIKKTWPEIKHFNLHLHNARGLALPSLYAAMRVMDENDTVSLDTTIGGIGGCPYCGNGRATGMIATEDVVHMFQMMGIDLGVDLDKLIRVVWMLDEVLGRTTMGHVSQAGPMPTTHDSLYDSNIPFVETHEQAKHFLLGLSVVEGGVSPWADPIPTLEELQAEPSTAGSV